MWYCTWPTLSGEPASKGAHFVTQQARHKPGKVPWYSSFAHRDSWVPKWSPLSVAVCSLARSPSPRSLWKRQTSKRDVQGDFGGCHNHDTLSQRDLLVECRGPSKAPIGLLRSPQSAKGCNPRRRHRTFLPVWQNDAQILTPLQILINWRRLSNLLTGRLI
jgi:hypothetical protein